MAIIIRKQEKNFPRSFQLRIRKDDAVFLRGIAAVVKNVKCNNTELVSSFSASLDGTAATAATAAAATIAVSAGGLLAAVGCHPRAPTASSSPPTTSTGCRSAGGAPVGLEASPEEFPT